MFKFIKDNMKKALALAAIVAAVAVPAFSTAQVGAPGSGGIGTPNYFVLKNGDLFTNVGNSLGTTDIHVGGCYIGPGTGTPCGTGVGGGVELGGAQTGFTNGMVQYITQAGLQGGDTLFTRNSTTNNTVIKKAVNANLTQGFEIGTTLLGLNGSFITGVNTLTGTSGYTGVVDLSGFGQSSTTAMMAAYDGVTTQSASVTNDAFRVSIVATGNTATGQVSATKTDVDLNFQTSAGLRSRFFGNGTEAYMRHQGLTDDLRIGADTGIYLYKNGSKMYFPSTITAPGAGYVLTTTGTGTTSWQLPTGGTPGGNDRNIQFNNAGAFGGSDFFKYDSNGNFTVSQTAGLGDLFTVLSTTRNINIGSAAQNMYFNTNIPGYSFDFFGNGDDTNTGLVYTPIGAPGLNDVSFIGNFKGSISPTTYTATVDAVNAAIFITDTPGAPGVAQGHMVDAYDGVTLLASGVVVSSVQQYPVSGAVVIDFGGADISTADRIFDNDNSTTYTGSFSTTTDSVTYVISNTGGTVTLTGYPILPTAVYENQGISVIGSAATGHTLGDEWSNSYTLTYTRMMKLDGLNNIITNQIYSDNGKLASTYLGDTSGTGIAESATSQFAVDIISGTTSSSSKIRSDLTNGFNYKFRSSGGSVLAEIEAHSGGIFNRTASWGVTSVGGDDLITASATNKAVKISGAWITENWTNFTLGTDITIQDNRSGFIYNPASLVANATITLPAGAASGANITVVFGGTITSGAVVTALTIAPNTGQTIIDANPPTTAVAGDALVYHLEGTTWYRIK